MIDFGLVSDPSLAGASSSPRLSIVIFRGDRMDPSEGAWKELLARPGSGIPEILLVVPGEEHPARVHPAFRVIHTPPRSRVEEQRTLGMLAAAGDIVAFVDASDSNSAVEQVEHLITRLAHLP